MYVYHHNEAFGDTLASNEDGVVWNIRKISNLLNEHNDNWGIARAKKIILRGRFYDVFPPAGYTKYVFLALVQLGQDTTLSSSNQQDKSSLYDLLEGVYDNQVKILALKSTIFPKLMSAGHDTDTPYDTEYFFEYHLTLAYSVPKRLQKDPNEGFMSTEHIGDPLKEVQAIAGVAIPNNGQANGSAVQIDMEVQYSMTPKYK